MVSKFWKNVNQTIFVQFTAVFLVAFAVRFFILQLRGYSFLGVDETIYTHWGRNLAANFSSGMPGWDKFFMPGWPVVLSLIFHISTKIYFARFCVVVFGSINCALVFLIGNELFDARTGLLAALILAFNPEHIFYSHYLQAEIGLEFIILVGTLSLCNYFRSPLSRKRILLGSFIFGFGLLFKHFTVIPFASFWGTMVKYVKISRSVLVVSAIVFMTPIILYSFNLFVQGKDYLMIINTPVKNVNEWSANRPKGLSFLKKGRLNVVGEKMHSVTGHGPMFFYRHVKKNFFNLWTPNTLTATRLYRHHYSWAHYPRRISYIFAAGYTFVMVFGLLGLCYHENTPFKLFAIGNLALLSALTLLNLVVSRYRVPFLFLLALFAADALLHLKEIPSRARTNAYATASFAVMMVMLLAIYIERLPRLGSWY